VIALTRRGRIALGVAIALLAGSLSFVLVRTFTGGPSCTPPSRLITLHGVTLEPEAMLAFRKAESIAGRRIAVVQSYRSCAAQALACVRVCGNSAGCPGTCAEPGTSYHQRGKAIDVTRASLEAPRVAAALQEAGWCQSVPESDPGHFSFDGCH
jgi:D-alanyl-D-alanine carboxypeptidase